jgi:hypothetical protein
MPRIQPALSVKSLESPSLRICDDQSSVMIVDPPSDEKDPRLDLVERIGGSGHFRKSPRLVHFLFYVVQREIDGRDDEISEQQIGVHVFGRSPTYNPGDDNIVRAYARNLRFRLEEYYRGEGKNDRLLIQIPRGAYRPIFIERSIDELGWNQDSQIVQTNHPLETAPPEAVAEGTLSLENPSLAPKRVTRWQKASFVIILGLLAIFIAALSYQAGEKNTVRVLLQGDHAFWNTLFNTKQDTLIVPGDSSLVLLEGVTHQLVTPDEYERKTYDTDVQSKLGSNSELIANLAQRPYTSIVDLQAANRLDSLPEVVPDRTHIRFARDLHIEDLRSSNIILLGSSLANPWVQLFDPQLSLHMTYQPADGTYRIEDSNPRAGEPASYPFSLQDPQHRAYALIALLPNLSGKGHVLLIEGTSMAGTQTALDFLFNDSSMESLMARCKMPDGSMGPFEVLLQTIEVGSRATGASILSEKTPLSKP